jgi:glycosyltransferase involved in cell wall biosynthesis
MRVLHAIHDFLPRHRAGSEIYAFELAREQSARHDVFVLAAEYDPAAAHGTLRWRSVGGLTVIEVVNNWEFRTFEETYSSPRINEQLAHALDAVRPDVVHVHNLLNLSFDLPRLASERGAVVAATVHDYTLVCPSGGQRVHVAEQHVCAEIDPARCSTCFVQSPFQSQMAAGRLTRSAAGRSLGRAGLMLRRLAPGAAALATRSIGRAGTVSPGDIRRRLASARHVFETVDLFVAPSASIGAELVRLGADRRRVEISDYGFHVPAKGPRAARDVNAPVRIGFVGTLVWHKGVHVLFEAARSLHGAFEIHLYGDATVFPEYVGRLRRTAAGVPVTFHGGFDRAHVAEVYSALDVLVVPSLWPENSPLVIHEAFMHGVTVVGSRTGGIPDLVVDGVNGLLADAFSPDSLRSALQRLISDSGLRARLAAAAPGVKTIAEDAAEWDARYGTLRSGEAALHDSTAPIESAQSNRACGEHV